MRSPAVRHLIHRPRSWQYPVPAVPDTEEEFVLVCEFPAGNAQGRRFHELLDVVGAVQEAAEFIGRCHFAVKPDRVAVFYRFGLWADDIAALHCRVPDGRLDVRLSVRPDKVVDGVPRVLEFRMAIRIDGSPCGAGEASLVFLAPGVHTNHRRHSRAALLAACGTAGGGGGAAAPAGSPVDPADIGYGDPRDVLLRNPGTADGRLSVDVTLPPPVDGEVPARVLLEAVRQVSLYTAVRAHGLAAGRNTLASLRAHFRGYAEPDLPLRCAAVWEPLGKDGRGRRLAPVSLSLIQADRAILETTTSVVEDL
ncbi:AfsA-related hotdog domain-containing protein [Streptomyces sp. NPDC057521]|uniref:AfsA-related hotdog domain-containing protein n=1 Tax=Streptomyces sp. NPDC057521 TaxID=3346156 RepID=UPI0036CA9C59